MFSSEVSTSFNFKTNSDFELNGKTLDQVLVEATAKIGEKISLRRVTRVLKDDAQSFGAYKHMGGKIVSLTVVGNVDEEVAKDIAMHVAAINPKYLNSDQISEEVIAHETQVLTNEALNEHLCLIMVKKALKHSIYTFWVKY